MIKIAASDSSAADKAAANVVCGATNSQNDINTAMNADNLSLYFFNGNYAIDAPVNIRSGCVLHGDSTDGVLFNCNNTTAVFRTSAPVTVHEQVRVESMSVQAGSHDNLGCDFRGFIRSHFDELKIAGFTTGVWFGGDLPTYTSCWSNQLSRFEIANNLVGVKLSGTNGSGVSTANNILLTEGEIICRDATGGKAIDAIDAEFVVDHCDTGYGNASAGIVIGVNANNHASSVHVLSGTRKARRSIQSPSPPAATTITSLETSIPAAARNPTCTMPICPLGDTSKWTIFNAAPRSPTASSTSTSMSIFGEAQRFQPEFTFKGT